MRHGKSGKTFGRNSALRKATVRDIAKATLLKGRIQTTLVKAKESRKLVDKLITFGKKGTLAAKRNAYAILCNHRLVSKLFDEIAPLFKNRQGGYTRVIRLAKNRRGDNATVAILELTEKAEVISEKKEKPKGKGIKVEKDDHSKVEKTTSLKGAEKEKPAKKKAENSKPSDKVKEKSSTKVARGIKKIFRKDTEK
ncbi:MAG: 50S ribosomal protein L17 [Candidatus Omnitrophica bacterium]|nr:50S ribosomal protein L17 [Candidatus Omnitrophota bacterium]